MRKGILLTGATGYLGSHLAQALADAGYVVVVLKRRSSSLARLDPVLSKVTLVDIEDCDYGSLFHEYGKIDAVIHCATAYGRVGETVENMVESNLAFPLKLLAAAAKANVQAFFNADTALDKFLNAYTLSKAQFAEWGRYFSQKRNISFFNLRLQHIYGPNDDDSKFTTYVIKGCLKNAQNLELTKGEQERDFIYIEDVVTAYLLLLEKQSSMKEGFAEFDIGSGETVTIREFSELVKDVSGSSAHLNFGARPYREGEVMYARAETDPLRKMGWRCNYTLEQGLKRAIEGSR